MTKKKIGMISISILGIVILGISILVLYSQRVRYSYDGYIWKDENGNVTAEIFAILYNGARGNKSLIFDINGGSEYLQGKLKNEKYEVTAIEIMEGSGRVDSENMILTIPGHGEVMLHIAAQNIYVGEDYQGEFIYLLRDAPDTTFIILK